VLGQAFAPDRGQPIAGTSLGIEEDEEPLDVLQALMRQPGNWGCTCPRICVMMNWYVRHHLLDEYSWS
jgi:hypothetical protein